MLAEVVVKIKVAQFVETQHSIFILFQKYKLLFYLLF